MLELIHGNKRYSSWSQRGYLALCHAGVAFSETAVWLDTEDGQQLLDTRCPNGSVPVMVDDGVVVADSLGIVWWLEAQHGVSFWPVGAGARAHAQNGVMAIHSGYTALREAMVCNYPKRYTSFEVPSAAQADIDRIFNWVCSARSLYGAPTGLPWLCGEYGAADIFYAPVLARCRTYGVRLPDAVEAWADAMESRDDMQAWLESAASESRRIAASEMDIA